ncbi:MULTISPECIES: radical SAM protein [Paenibacillus]|jgi:MoaA/NifB/PqqE/SkfB family radical SAM enzyme|uniref:Radical SAM protein n=1 Tax=Paenibacillus odorifer TaxID=189426 RepID=A0AB36JJQ1_9BACL|nr:MULTISPECIES: radical SAM protein [Paenibacillus]AIQ73547.1 Fe-S oxidoreductase [Paenibacillus odorifer]MDH6426383.1 MoaA/NifB/PqqE/SkfB family radical SAM enzyme [Paenibacillus sp. PastH-4]MDH6442406.1 MoaA/NifB/PqqE/SkfB family radical SAM enzyme [Paenibacillus sp. PastF-4]MDH6526881.1 MoaA/NifB/PqqE/SkfB family radical SAM enzyme [Paenibacillus sp. PastH-3]MEC0134947.1 radical SAM protein [Paenibacillus odorifer]
MRYKALELDKPLTYELEGLEIGVTSNCNFRCDYCCAYNRNDGQSIKAKEVIRILDELPGLKRVRLSGGEVTLKFDDCVEIVTYCASRGIQTQLNSNGSLLNAERIGQLVSAGLTTIHISFNFTTAEAFSKYYNIHPSIYEKIRENITLFAATSVDTVLETLLFSETQDNMKEISDHVYAMGVRTHEIQNSIIMDHTGWKSIAAREQLKNAVSELIARKKEDTILYFTCMDRFMDALGFEEQPGVYFPHCIEGKKQLHLHGNGDILISELCHPVIIGNIYQGTSLKDLYNNMPAPLAQFLDKQPCPALDALFPQGIEV